MNICCDLVNYIPGMPILFNILKLIGLVCHINTLIKQKMKEAKKVHNHF